MQINTFLEHQEKDTQNVINVKKLYKALNGGDMVTISKLLIDNPTWDVCPGFPDSGIYSGMAEVFGTFYKTFLNRIYRLQAVPEAYIDGGDVVTVLGFYNIMFSENDPITLIRFSHTWKIAPDSLIEGVWQVADSAVVWEGLKTK